MDNISHNTTVSAIVSAYHCADWLQGRMVNLLEQTVVPHVIAVCQKGSKEQDILSRFQCTTIVTQNIPGLYEAWNIAIKSSTDDYIMIANSDDRLAKFATLTMKTILDVESSVGLVYSNFHVVDKEDGEPLMIANVREPDSDLMDGCYVGSSPMWRRSIHSQIGYFDETYMISGDYEFWIRMQKCGVKFAKVNEPLYKFWQRGDGDNLEYRYVDRLIWEQAKARRKWKSVN